MSYLQWFSKCMTVMFLLVLSIVNIECVGEYQYQHIQVWFGIQFQLQIKCDNNEDTRRGKK